MEKIDEGLAKCDFGIVVLSKHFFEKKWPRAELEGLFARETRSGKIILPIWKDITEDEVKTCSPILASRVALSTTAGLPKVLEEIRLVVGVSKRQRELSVLDAAARRVEILKKTIADNQRAEQLLRSEQGAKLVKSSFEGIWAIIQDVLCAKSEDSASLKFHCRRSFDTSMYVSTVRGMNLNLNLAKFFMNHAVDTRLEVTIFRQEWDRFNQPLSELMTRFEVQFQPTFRSSDEIVWFSSDKSARGSPYRAFHRLCAEGDHWRRISVMNLS